MSRLRPGVANQLALLLAAISISMVAVVALDRPVRAATDVTVGEVVATMKSLGMDCISKNGFTLCFKVAVCKFDADGPPNRTCSWSPDDGAVLIGTVEADVAIAGTPSIPIVDLEYEDESEKAGSASDASGAKNPFQKVIGATCPGAIDAASDWFAQATPEDVFPGDGCEVRLAIRAGEDQDFTLNIHGAQGFVASPSVSALPSPTTSASVPSVAPSASIAVVIASPAPSPSAGVVGVISGDPPSRIAAPGEFVASVAPPSRINVDLVVVLQSAVLALLILLLMPFPAQLFNSTVEENREEIEGWFAPLRRAVRGTGSAIGAFWRSPPGIVLFLVISALLYALLDPGFTLSADGLISLLGILVGLVLVTVLFALPSVVWHRRLGDRPVIRAIPFTILVALACVAISRIVDFQPGYLYGLIIGLGFAKELDPAGEGRSGAAAALLMLVAALLAWIGLGMLVDSGAQGFVAAVLETMLAVVMVAGLEGVAFGLLPIRFLPGEPIYAWNRIVWGALIGIGLFAFFHLLINPDSGYLADTSRTPLITVIALLIGFAVLSVAFWGYFRYRPKRVAT